MNPTHFFRHQLLKLKWRGVRKRGHTLRLRIGNAPKFFAALNAADIRYVVLRWFDEVPLGDASTHNRDVDLLAESARLADIVRIAASCPGGIKCDLYTNTGKLGTAYKRFPYYPPVLAEEILSARESFSETFFVPAPALHFKSLAYHLVYHKGAASGIPTGTEIPTDAHSRRSYQYFIEMLGEKLGVGLKRPYTLLALHEHLKSIEWSMPHDLMVRWPQQHDWMHRLARHEEKPFEAFACALPDVIVFLSRADAAETAMEARALELLRSRFRVLKMEPLDAAQIRRVMHSVRGGNWVEHREGIIIEPRVAWVCHDPQPQPVPENDPLRRKYPLVQNQNVFFKNEIRDRLNELFPAQPKRIAIHGSDNAMETQHYLHAIYGGRHADICDELERLCAR